MKAATAVLLVAFALPARAQPDDANAARAKALYDEAYKHYNLREYAAAIDGFRKAYDLMPDSEFLFDIAQAYRLNRDCDNAAAFYRNYLRDRPDADNRAKVEKFIADMNDCSKRAAAEREAERERKQREVAAAAARTTPAPPADHTLRDAGLITAGVGVIALAFGAYFSIDAVNESNAIQNACKLGCEAIDVAPFDRSGRDDNRNATILYVGGGVALAAGVGIVVWTLLNSNEHSVVVAPAPSGAEVSARWRF